jgi:hypothetical protein
LEFHRLLKRLNVPAGAGEKLNRDERFYVNDSGEASILNQENMINLQYIVSVAASRHNMQGEFLEQQT